MHGIALDAEQDIDGSGGLVWDEFDGWWRSRQQIATGGYVDEAVLQRGHALFAELDGDGDGILSLGEFVEVLQQLAASDWVESIDRQSGQMYWYGVCCPIALILSVSPLCPLLRPHFGGQLETGLSAMTLYRILWLYSAPCGLSSSVFKCCWCVAPGTTRAAWRRNGPAPRLTWTPSWRRQGSCPRVKHGKERPYLH